MEIPRHLVEHYLELRGEALTVSHIEHARLVLMGERCPLCAEFDDILRASLTEVPEVYFKAFRDGTTT